MEGGVKWFEARERFTGFTWPHLTALCLLSGMIGALVAFWWQLSQDWFPVLSLVIGATVILVNVALIKLAGRIVGRYQSPRDHQAGG
jgi:hypothetical protein